MVMEDPVVRKTWLNTITAALCAVGAAATTAEGSPADMLPWKRSSATPPAPSAPAGVPPAMVQAGPPSALISPYRHPIKYLGAAISEMPLPGRSKQGKTVAAKPKAKHDSIGLDTATGPPSPQLMISMAQMCERSGDTAGARHHYQEALKMWPGQVDVLRAAARMEDRLGGLALAESLYQQAVAANPQHAGAHNDLGLCLARQGKLEPSIQVIEQAVCLQPDKPLYRNNAATVLVELRQDQRALAHLSAVHGGAEANFNMGQLLVQRGRPMDAAPYFACRRGDRPVDASGPRSVGETAGADGWRSTDRRLGTAGADGHAGCRAAADAADGAATSVARWTAIELPGDGALSGVGRVELCAARLLRPDGAVAAAGCSASGPGSAAISAARSRPAATAAAGHRPPLICRVACLRPRSGVGMYLPF